MARRGTTAKIELRELEKLCALQATDEEVAAFFEVSVRTIERRRKNPKFAEIMERGKAKGRLSLRRLQFRLAEHGSAAVAIFLGKQLLGQTDWAGHSANGSNTYIFMPQVAVVIGRDPRAVTALAPAGAPDSEVIDINGAK